MLHNEAVHNLYFSPNSKGLIISDGVRRAGRVSRRGKRDT
jgi:hypothetical protein